MKRWIKNILAALQKGLVSVFVCAVVLLPLLLAVMQWGNIFSNSNGDKRKVIAMEQMAIRSADRNTAPLKPFDEPLITVTFDDGWESIYTTGLPLLQKYGIPTTQYVLSGVDKDVNYLTIEQIKAMQKAGHEIGCHSIDHADLTSLTPVALQSQLAQCKAVFEQALGTPVKHFASPYGRSNPQTITAIKGLYASHRNTNGDITTNGVSDQDVNIRGSFNPYNIHAITIRRDTTVEQLQKAIDFTIKNNGWLVLNYHDVEEGDSTYGLDAKSLELQLIAINRAQARVVTLGQVMDVMSAKDKTGTPDAASATNNPMNGAR